MPLVTAVIPCYNEQAVLPQMFERLAQAANQWGVDWNVLCVDDGSQDRTWELLVEQSRKDPRFQAIRFSRNFGHQPAVSAGLAQAKGDAVVVMDADLQDPPATVADFIAKWKEGYRVVYGVRTLRNDETLLKKFTAWAFYRTMSKLTEFKMPLDSGDFCLLDRKVVEVLKSMPENDRFIRGLRAWAGFRQTGVPFERAPRAAGATHYNYQRMIKLAFNAIFSFSTMPLRLVTALGYCVSGIAFLGMVFTFFQRIFKDYFIAHGWGSTPGFATTVICVLFMGGIQLICLGIIGEYLGRTFNEVKRRPGWIISEHTGGDDAP
jgi:dolichol-phosphate mannosyltransferase